MAALVTLQSIPPHETLAPYIREIQVFRVRTPSDTGVTLHHLPTGNVSLWLCFGAVGFSSLRYGRLPQGVIVGVHDQVEVYRFCGHGEVINVLFEVAGVRTFVPFPLSELLNRMLPITQIWPRWLIQAIVDLEAYDLPQRSACLGSLLYKYALSPERFDRRIAAISRQILLSHGRAPVLPLADQLALSSSQLERLCRDQFGLTPKRLARLTRFYFASRLMRLETPQSWAMFAANAGYADQAHFIREFRTFSGYTPAAFAQAGINAEFLQYAPQRGSYPEDTFLLKPQETR